MTAQHQTLLETVYKECNEHAREQPKRRDSIISIYLLVYAAYLSFITGEKTFSINLLISLMIVVTLFGFMCSLIVINFRCWSIQYISCCQAIAALLMSNVGDLSAKEITMKLWSMVERKCYTSKSFFKRAENIIVLSFILVTSTPIIAIIDLIKIDSDLIRYLIIALYIVAYNSILIISMVKQIKEADSGNIKSKNHTKFPTWIINYDICYKNNEHKESI